MWSFRVYAKTERSAPVLTWYIPPFNWEKFRKHKNSEISGGIATMRSGKQEHETDSGALCAQGEQDARALTVRGTARAKRDGARLET